MVNYVERRVEGDSLRCELRFAGVAVVNYVERRVKVEGSKRKEVAKVLLSLFALCFSVVEILVLNL